MTAGYTRRRGIGILCALLLALAAAAQEADPPTSEELTRRLLDAYAAGDVAAALRWGEELAVHLPDNAVLAFDLSRLRAVSGDREGALGWLRGAVEKGFSRVERLDEEPDLETLRDHPEFPALRRRVAESFARRVAAQPPLLTAPRQLDPETPVPLLIVLHGRGSSAEPLEKLWRPEARRLGAVLVTPQGLEPYAEGFQWGTVSETEQQVLAAIAYAEARYPIDRRRILLTGFSQGGGRSIAIALRRPELFAGVIVIASAIGPGTPFPPPPGTRPPPFVLMVGSRDGVLPHTRETAERFAEHGIVHKLVVFPGVGHTFPRDYRRQLRRATEFVLRSSADPVEPE